MAAGGVSPAARVGAGGVEGGQGLVHLAGQPGVGQVGGSRQDAGLHPQGGASVHALQSAGHGVGLGPVDEPDPLEVAGGGQRRVQQRLAALQDAHGAGARDAQAQGDLARGRQAGLVGGGQARGPAPLRGPGGHLGAAGQAGRGERPGPLRPGGQALAGRHQLDQGPGPQSDQSAGRRASPRDAPGPGRLQKRPLPRVRGPGGRRVEQALVGRRRARGVEEGLHPPAGPRRARPAAEGLDALVRPPGARGGRQHVAHHPLDDLRQRPAGGHGRQSPRALPRARFDDAVEIGGAVGAVETGGVDGADLIDDVVETGGPVRGAPVPRTRRSGRGRGATKVEHVYSIPPLPPGIQPRAAQSGAKTGEQRPPGARCRSAAQGKIVIEVSECVSRVRGAGPVGLSRWKAGESGGFPGESLGAVVPRGSWPAAPVRGRPRPPST